MSKTGILRPGRRRQSLVEEDNPKQYRPFYLLKALILGGNIGAIMG